MKLLSYSLIFLLFAGLISCNKNYVPTAKVLQVRRGDLVLIPFTFIDPHSAPRKFRLLGIQAPDPGAGDENIKEAYYGILSKQFTKKWVRNLKVAVERPVKRSNGVTDRGIGWIKNPKTGEYLHEALLRAGLARSTGVRQDLGERGEIILRLEAEARAAQVGMWTTNVPPGNVMADFVRENTGIFGKLMDVIRPQDKPKGFATQDQQNQPAAVAVPNQNVQAQPVVSQAVVPQTVVPQQQIVAPQPVVNPRPLVPSYNPVQNTVPTQQLSASALLESSKLLEQINGQADLARREFLRWQALPADQRAASAQAVRQKLRNVKIYIMDGFDEGPQMNEGQRIFLQSLREDMNRLMGLIRQMSTNQ